jgi:GTP-binding protein
VAVGPPTFVVFSSRQLPPPYARYLERSLRERYGFVGTPLVIRRGGGRPSGPGS